MITKLLKFEEGFRAYPYQCSEGYPTIGIGKRIGNEGTPLSAYQFTVSEPLAELWLSEEVGKIIDQLNDHNFYVNLDSVRKDIIVSMGYQLGLNGLLKFKKMIAALEIKDWQLAQYEGLDSLWAKQTPDRANRHMDVILSGTLEAYDGLLG